ncbi:DUF6250 domain-containing protein [Pelagicoccus sp. SDUM812002]|uniref:DUF6250 domain-containing protein n=1 Tax=Pelagicoccus sp. SDUM812002 TaxID=3041266 RepID=UPI00280F965F|nr:DUF6250 domain-containing protein [Pelagicoccus sp. SDUM812002]MDQ8184028.1 DUF6250 domain-containing protein [Pelagicoccus sp. SDUM812002]
MCSLKANGNPDGEIAFEASMDDWVVEQQPGGEVQIEDGVLEIKDKKGCTVWYKHSIQAPVRISYTVTANSTGRISDINCFWMASDLDHLDDLFAEGHGREGAFAQYDDLQLYYVGYGGNYNATTRFRRYLGRGEKPLLPGFDLSAGEFLIESDKAYRIELVADGRKAQYFRDGELVFEYEDPEPLTRGWFGFRTVWSHLSISDLRIERID